MSMVMLKVLNWPMFMIILKIFSDKHKFATTCYGTIYKSIELLAKTNFQKK